MDLSEAVSIATKMEDGEGVYGPGTLRRTREVLLDAAMRLLELAKSLEPPFDD